MTPAQIAAAVCREAHGGEKWSKACHQHKPLADVVAAAAVLDRALNDTIEAALWLDSRASRRVYRARCRVGRALEQLRALERELART